MKRMFTKSGIIVSIVILLFTALNAQSFTVQRIGNGHQAVILIPGFACSGEVWHRTAETLQNYDYSCYVLTMPGFSGVPPENNPSFENWANQIINFIQTENIESPILIGHSMGGGLALMIASTNPNLINSIVVVDALPCLGAIYNPNFQTKKITSDEFANAEAELLGMSDEQFYRHAYISAISLTTDSLRYDDLVKWSLQSDRKTYAKIFYDYSNVDLRKNIKRLSVPTLVLLEYPFKKIASVIEQQFGHSPTVRIEYAEKGLHFIMFDDWEWYIRQITDFLNQPK